MRRPRSNTNQEDEPIAVYSFDSLKPKARYVESTAGGMRVYVYELPPGLVLYHGREIDHSTLDQVCGRSNFFVGRVDDANFYRGGADVGRLYYWQWTNVQRSNVLLANGTETRHHP